MRRESATIDDTPVWERSQFADVVVGASLSAEAPSTCSTSMTSLIESLSLASLQLESLFGEASIEPTMRQSAGKVQKAFKSCVELCRHLPLVKDVEVRSAIEPRTSPDADVRLARSRFGWRVRSRITRCSRPLLRASRRSNQVPWSSSLPAGMLDS